MSTDLRPLHRRALADVTALVGALTADDLATPSTCAGWSLADLLAHMVGQHDGFAAAVRDGDAPVDAYAPVPFTQRAWDDSVAALLDAFAAADLDAEVLEVELHPTRPLPAHVLVGAQLLDTAVHAWDVAASIGRSYTPDDEIVAAVLAVAEPIPDGPGRERPGAAFAHAVTPADDHPWTRALALLGRHR